MSDSKSPSRDPILSPDILAIVATYLALSDLKPFRLVGRQFCALADPLLFESISVGHQPRVLEVFTNICKHEYFRRLVRKLRYNTTALPEMIVEQ